MSADGDAGLLDGDFRLEELTREGDGWTATVTVPESSRWFEGHFPGEPILPGVGQVDLVAALARRIYREEGAGGSGAEWECGGISNLRLSGQVRPDDRLRVDLRPEGDRVGFALRATESASDSSSARGGKRVSNGALLAAPDPEAAAPDHESPSEAGAAVTGLDPTRRLPHGPPSLLALEVIGFDPGTDEEAGAADAPGPAILCRGRVPAANAAARNGQAGAWMAIELAAQAAGLLQAANRPDGGPTSPPIGYLVRVRQAHFTTGHLPVDADLLARAELEGSNGPLSLYRATVGIPGGFALATASLGTFVAEA